MGVVWWIDGCVVARILCAALLALSHVPDWMLPFCAANSSATALMRGRYLTWDGTYRWRSSYTCDV